MFGGIVNSAPYFVRRIIGLQGTGWTTIDALATIDTNDLRQGFVHEGADAGFMTSTNRFENAHFLEIDTGPHTTAAQNTLVHVTPNRIARIVGFIYGLVRMSEPEKVHAILFTQGQQFTSMFC
jgi:hypothetical protein